MNEENIVLDENSNTSEEVIDLDLDNNTEEEVVEEELDVEQLLAEKKKAEELAHNYKIRAEKAEAQNKKPKPQATQSQSSLTVYDTIALMNAKVTEAEDIKEVEEYARFKGISVSEALKSGVVKTLLSEKAETRRTAQATNTGKARAGSATISDDVLLKSASQGKLPDDPASLVAARFNRK